jgi:hypothetical protein
MVMRYHWGLSVGHTYAHTPSNFSQDLPSDDDDIHREDESSMESCPLSLDENLEDKSESESDAELMNTDRDDDNWVDDSESDTDENGVEAGDCSNDESLLATYEMYGC